MNEKGFPLVHASCISKDNHAFLFLARSGGKREHARNGGLKQ